MVGVFGPTSIGIEEVGVGRTWASHGNGAPGGSVGSGDRAFVSSFSSCAMTSAGVVSSRPDVSSRRTERSAGRIGISDVSVDSSYIMRLFASINRTL